MRFLTAVALALVMLWVPVDGVAQTDCPDGTWPSNLYSGPGGGLYTGPGSYCSNRPPLPAFLRYLEKNGYENEATLIRRALR